MSEVSIQTERSSLVIIEKYYYSILVGVVFLLGLWTDLYIPLTAFLTLLTIVKVLYKLGKGIVLRELIALHSVVICLLMPAIGYLVYTQNNSLARLWVRFMLVPESEYFSYALPAISAFVGILCWPIDSAKVSDEGAQLQNLINNIKAKLQKQPRVGLYIIITGVLMFFFGRFLPAALQFVTTLFFWGAFAGILYIYYTDNFKRKKLTLFGFAFLILANAVQSGMFTIVAYMGITLFSFFFLSSKTGFFKKAIIFVIGTCLLLLIQEVKMTFRRMTWMENYQGNKMLLFGELMFEKAGNLDNLFSEKAFFPIYYRANQGFNVTLVMRRFPNVQPYDNGSMLATTLAASLVPRLFWPDKPTAGGKNNMKHYTGVTLRGWSTNVGPLGEAYGSFGPIGGIVFMFVIGAFIRWSYRLMFSLSRKVPFLIFWLPVLFYQVTYSAESDTLQILNSLFKSAFFVWGLSKLLPGWFGIVKKTKYYKKFYRPGVPAPVAEQ